MVFVITAQTKKDSQAAHTDFTRSVYMESDTQPDKQTVLEKWKQKYGNDLDESTLEIVPLKDMRTSCVQMGWKSQRFEAIAANSRANSSICCSISWRVTMVSFFGLSGWINRIGRHAPIPLQFKLVVFLFCLNPSRSNKGFALGR